jgi:deazaflavin-dependent oxidoreductase (nitroreductase family)
MQLYAEVPMSTRDATSFEDALIEDMRAHGGAVTSGPLAGHPLLVLSNTGARTGAARRAILTYSRDAGDYVVAGTAGGSPRIPAWVVNVRRHPEVLIEAATRRFRATATVLAEGPERDRLWNQHVAGLPHFAAYPAKARRIIPIVRLTPLGRDAGQ